MKCLWNENEIFMKWKNFFIFNKFNGKEIYEISWVIVHNDSVRPTFACKYGALGDLSTTLEMTCWGLYFPKNYDVKYFIFIKIFNNFFNPFYIFLNIYFKILNLFTFNVKLLSEDSSLYVISTVVKRNESSPNLDYLLVNNL